MLPATTTRPLVLVVDDDLSVLRFITVALRANGIDVLTEGTGAGVVETYRRRGGEIALVLSDVQMPGLDGPALLGALQALDGGVRCVFMSGSTGRYSTEQLLALGAAHVLPKPLGPLYGFIETVRGAARNRGQRIHFEPSGAGGGKSG